MQGVPRILCEFLASAFFFLLSKDRIDSFFFFFFKIYSFHPTNPL